MTTFRIYGVYIRPTSDPHLSKVATDAILKTSYSHLMGHKMFVAVLAGTLYIYSYRACSIKTEML